MANATIQQPNVLVNRADVLNILDAVHDAVDPEVCRVTVDAIRALILSRCATYGDVTETQS